MQSQTIKGRSSDSIALVRIENLAPEAVLLGNSCEVRGRVFIPSGADESLPEVELLLEECGREGGAFSAGLRIVGQRIPCDNAGTEADSNIHTLSNSSALLVPIESEGDDIAGSGSWYSFTRELTFLETVCEPQYYFLSATCRTSTSYSISNLVSLIREPLEQTSNLWRPHERITSAREYGGLGTCLGNLLIPSSEIKALKVHSGDREIGEIAWDQCSKNVLPKFPGLQQEDITSVSIIFSQQELPFAIEVPLYLSVERAGEEVENILIPRPVIEETPTEIVSSIESISMSADNRVRVEGWCIAPAELEVFAISIQTISEILDFSNARLEFASCEFRFRDDIEQRFSQWTQFRPWGFSVEFYPHVFSGRDGMPRLICQDHRTGVAYPIGTSADQRKIYELLQQVQTPVSTLRSLAKTASALCSAKKVDHDFIPGAFRERYSAEFPSRIVFVTHNFSATEGAPKVLFNLVRWICDCHPSPDLEILVVGAGDGELIAEYKSLGVKVLLYSQLHPAAYSIASFRDEFSKALKDIRQFNPDFIYANTIGGFWGVEIASRLGVRSTWAIHESKKAAEWGLELSTYFARKVFHYLNAAKDFIFVARTTRELLGRWQEDAHIAVIPNGINLEDKLAENKRWTKSIAREQLGISGDTKVVTIVGTTTHRKGQDIFIDAAAELKTRNPQESYRFLVVGCRPSPYFDSLKRQASALGLDDVLSFVPETKNVAPYFRASDVMSICSREESAPLVSLEAFAYERPLVSTNVFGLAEQLEDETNSLIFALDDSKELADKLERVLGDEELASRLVKQGCLAVKERFMLENSLAQHWQQMCAAFQRVDVN